MAERKNKKGRAMREMLIEVRKKIKIEEVETKKLIEVGETGGVKWRGIIRGDIDRKLEKLSEKQERRKEGSRV